MKDIAQSPTPEVHQGNGALRSPRLAIHAANAALVRALRRAFDDAEILRDTSLALDPEYLSGCWYTGQRSMTELAELLEVAEETRNIALLPELMRVKSRRPRRAKRDTALQAAA